MQGTPLLLTSSAIPIRTLNRVMPAVEECFRRTYRREKRQPDPKCAAKNAENKGWFSHLSANDLRLNWLFQPKSKAKPDQSQGEQGAEDEEHGGHFFTAEQEKANKTHQAGEER